MKTKNWFVVVLMICSLLLFGSVEVRASEANETTEDTTTDYVLKYHTNGGDFVTEDGEVSTEITINNGETYTLVTNVYRAGYTFAGWCSDEGLQNSIVSIAAGNTSDLEVYAKWESDEYSINYVIADYNIEIPEDAPTVYNIESDQIDLPELELEGYVFIGWHKQKDLNDTAIMKIEAGSIGNLTLYPEFAYNAQPFAVDGTNYLLDIGGVCVQKSNFTGNVIIPETVQYNEREYSVIDIEWDAFEDATGITSITLPTEISYLPDGIFDSCTELLNFVTYSSTLNISGILPLHANVKCFYNSAAAEDYNEAEFTGNLTYFTVPLQYVLDGGILAESTESYVVGSILNLPIPVKEGYTFSGWYTNEEFLESSALGEIFITDDIASNVVLYAKWVKSVYSIKYELNGGTNNSSNPTTYTYRVGTALKDPTRAGYRFDGWYEDSSFTKKVKRITTAAQKDYVLYAKWKPLANTDKQESIKGTYKITYDLNGGVNSSANPDSFDGDREIILKKPTRKGYKFLYWCTDKNFRNKITKIAAGTKVDVTLYAKWSKITVKKTSFKAVQNKKGKKLSVSFKKVSGVNGYQLQYSTSKSFAKKKTKTITLSKKKSTYTSKKLKAKAVYYVRIRGYQTDSTGEKVYGKWSSKKKIRIIN